MITVIEPAIMDMGFLISMRECPNHGIVVHSKRIGLDIWNCKTCLHNEKECTSFDKCVNNHGLGYEQY